jgi:hypothetical protein
MEKNNPNGFFFKCRMSAQDWATIEQIIQRDHPHLYIQGNYPHARIRDWVTNQITRLAKNHMQPLLQDYHQQPFNTNRQEMSFAVPEIYFDGTSNLQILKEYAEMKSTSMCSVVVSHIIERHIEREEARKASSIILLK